MTDLIVPENGFTLTPIEGELRIHDLELAVRLGFERPRSIRNLIKANLKKLNEFNVCYAVEQTSGELGGRPATEYYLNRKQAIFICMKSETDNAFDVQIDIIRVYDAHLNGDQHAIALPDFTDPVAAAGAWANEVETKQLALAQTRALTQQIETDKPYTDLARAITGQSTMTRRDWCALMKDDHGANIKESALTAWLIDAGHCYRDPLTHDLRAYAASAPFFKLEVEVINGFPRKLLKVTGDGVFQLTPVVLSAFDQEAA
jgi:phage antirepressor YoqD-like protein